MKSLAYYIFALLLLTSISSCQNSGSNQQADQKEIKSDTNKQYIMVAHRGCRGLLPENTIPAFLHGIELGADCIEMDVYITKDNKVVVSHDPTISPLFGSNPDGSAVTPEQSKELIIYNMTYDELEKYDVGKRQNPRFPRQKTMPVKIPLLSDVFKAVDNYYKENSDIKKRIIFIIEIKGPKRWDKIYHPEIPIYVDRVMEEIQKYHGPDRVIMHSFDVRSVNYIHKKYPSFTVSYLKRYKGVKVNLDSVDFTPKSYEPLFSTLTKTDVDSLHQFGIKVVPWTVDTLFQMEEMIEILNVDGLTSDYPDITIPRWGDKDRQLDPKTLTFKNW
ncbi:MAG: glycerophosphodiester phosphodiesterase family protein [Hyphomicrobiales bacterium]